MLKLGTTIWNLSGPSSLVARKASFSQEMNTSPTPRSVKVISEPRAPESSTGTLPYSEATNCCALAGSLPNFFSA